ncbi:CRISPR-associated protein Cas6, partial [Haloarcula sp. Atlit-7R]
MRVMTHLSARADAAYQNDYHHKLRGRLWEALDDTKYDQRHDDGEPPGFVYSNPFPPHDMEAGDDRKLLVASPEEELLAHVAADLLEEPELNIGEMPFRV